jgi:hypothetical protein
MELDLLSKFLFELTGARKNNSNLGPEQTYLVEFSLEEIQQRIVPPLGVYIDCNQQPNIGCTHQRYFRRVASLEVIKEGILVKEDSEGVWIKAPCYYDCRQQLRDCLDVKLS